MLFLCLAIDVLEGPHPPWTLLALAARGVSQSSGLPREAGDFFRRAETGAGPAMLGMDASRSGEARPQDGTEGTHAALAGLDDWLGSRAGEPSAPSVLTGFAVSQDMAFLMAAYRSVGRDFPFASAALDLRSLAIGVLGLGWEQSAPSELIRRLGLGTDLDEGEDQTVQEARTAAAVLTRLLERLRRRSLDEGLFR